MSRKCEFVAVRATISLSYSIRRLCDLYLILPIAVVICGNPMPLRRRQVGRRGRPLRAWPVSRTLHASTVAQQACTTCRPELWSRSRGETPIRTSGFALAGVSNLADSHGASYCFLGSSYSPESEKPPPSNHD